MNAEQLIADFRRMLADKWGYIPATSGETWTTEKQAKAAAGSDMVRKYGAQWIGHHVADCSGAFVYAYRQHGLSIYHGSNRIAREYVRELLPPDQARPGMAAFKARKPGESLYDLPAEYRHGGRHYNGDLLDYYHIGLVDSDPAYVLNSQSTATGFVRSKLKSGWAAVGYLKNVQYDGGDQVDGKQMIVTGDGYVNMRAAPRADAPRVEKLHPGNIVTQLMDYATGWAYVQHGTKQGYVMSEFLEPYTSPAPGGDAAALDVAALTQYLYEALEHNQAEREALEAMQRLITGAVG